jgi:hypothetical protein
VRARLEQSHGKPTGFACASGRADAPVALAARGPQDAAGRADTARGLRSFVVGTGGTSPYAFDTIRATSEARISGSFGVIRLTLRNDRFQWDFIDVTGVTRDTGEALCH